MSSDDRDAENQLLAEVCKRHQVEESLVGDLLEIEKEFRFKDYRMGVSDRLKRRLVEEIGED